MRKPNTQCKICGKPLYRKPSELGKYSCCREHRSELYKKYKNYSIKGLRAGRGWNKGMSKANGDILSYGQPRSAETKQKISNALQNVLIKKGEIRECLICGKEFYNYPNEDRKYCSRECTYKSQLKQKIVKCAYCGKEFSTNEKRDKKLCSVKCQRLYSGQTDIEKIIEDWLIENKIDYEKEKPLLGITIVDFFVEPNIVIYCDGDYWHNLPLIKRKDYLQNKTLKEHGYKVIRLWGSDIKKGLKPNL